MRRAIVFLLLLISFGWSFNIQEYIGPNESAKSVTYLDMAGPKGAYVMYYLDNEPIMLVQGDTIIEDKEILVAVLQQYFFNKDFPKPGELEDIRAKAIAFNDSRKNLYRDQYIKEFFPGEDYCRQITGLKVRHCDKNQTLYHPCLMSCGAVQICKGSILEGGITSMSKSTKNFLDGILDFDDETMNLDNYALGIINLTNKLETASYSTFSKETISDFSTLVTYMEGIEISANKIKDNILFSDLLPATGLQPYCGPVNYSTDTAKELTTTAQGLKARMQNLLNTDAIADAVLNRTKERKQLKVQIETQTAYGSKFDAMDKTYNDLYAKYVKVSKYVNDPTLANEIDTMRAKKDSARDDIYRGNYNKAELTIKQFNVLSDAFSQKINVYFGSISQLEEYRTMADKKIVIAEWDLEISNIFLNQQLQDVKIRKSALDDRLARKIAPEELADVITQYSNIVTEVDEIIQAKREHALDTVLSKVVLATNTYSDTIASAYASTSDGSYQQRKQTRDYVLPLTLIMADLVAIGVFIAAFTYMVWSGRIRLRRIAAIMWSLIFIAFFLVVAGGSIAAYILIDQKTSKANFDTFYNELSASSTAAIVLDKTVGDVSDTCAKGLKRTLESQNKTVYLYHYNSDGCVLKDYTKGASVANMTGVMAIATCDEVMGQAPRIFLKSASTDSTTFSVKYYPSATVAGSADYMEQCQLGAILAEGQ